MASLQHSVRRRGRGEGNKGVNTLHTEVLKSLAVFLNSMEALDFF